jgi:hypothetical protein
VWFRRCQTRIGSVCGSVTGLSAVPPRNTRVPANSGSQVAMGDLSSKWPSSHSIIAATAVMGLVME